jgi:hypothetical protein
LLFIFFTININRSKIIQESLFFNLGLSSEFQEMAQIQFSLQQSLQTLQSTMQQFISVASQVLVTLTVPHNLQADSSFPRHPPLAFLPVVHSLFPAPVSSTSLLPSSLLSVPIGDHSQQATFSIVAQAAHLQNSSDPSLSSKSSLPPSA